MLNSFCKEIKKMLNGFCLAHYRFTILPESTISLPMFNKGSILRGAFGSSLRKLICTMGAEAVCETCMLKEKCAYVLIFNPINLHPAKRLYNTPRGYVLKPSLDNEKEYSADKPLTFDMILIGDRIEYLPYVIVPLMELSRAGLGFNRGKFTLHNIEVIKNGSAESIYDPSANMVKNIRKQITAEEIMHTASRLNPHELTLHFLTPTRIKYNSTGERGGSELVRIPEFHHLIRPLRHRINALSLAYCGAPLDLDFRGIADRAQSITIRNHHMEWLPLLRYRSFHPSLHDQSGFIGPITYAGDLAAFLPLLLL